MAASAVTACEKQASGAHSVMKDVLDVEGIYDAIRKAGLPLPDRARASDIGDALVNVFIKYETDPTGGFAAGGRFR